MSGQRARFAGGLSAERMAALRPAVSKGECATMPTPRIEDYRFGRIKIDGESYGKDLIICPDGVTAGWWRVTGHSLAMDDLAAVLEAKPEVLVIGQGVFGQMKVPEDTLASLQAAGIEVIAQPTAEACKTYNRLRDKRRVAAALHLTC